MWLILILKKYYNQKKSIFSIYAKSCAFKETNTFKLFILLKFDRKPRQVTCSMTFDQATRIGR